MKRDSLPIPSPCPADWNQMHGDARKRFCGQCDKHVHDLSAMTEPQAQALVANETDLCVRYLADADGRVRHAAPRQGLRRTIAAAALGVALLSPPALAGTMPATSATGEDGSLMERLVRRIRAWFGEEEPVAVAGMLEMPPPPPPPPPPEPPPELEQRLGRIAPEPARTIPELQDALSR